MNENTILSDRLRQFFLGRDASFKFVQWKFEWKTDGATGTPRKYNIFPNVKASEILFSTGKLRLRPDTAANFHYP